LGVGLASQEPPSLLKLPPNLLTRQPLKTIKPSLLQGVGRVIVAHARLELLLTELVSDLLRIGNPLGRQAYQGHNPVETFTIVKRLLKVWGITPKTNLNSLASDIEKAYSRRNAIAHGAWFRIKRNDVRMILVREERVTPIGPLSRRTIPDFAKQRVSQFRTDANHIHSITRRVLELRKLVAADLKSWPRTIPSRLPRRPAGPRGSKTR
jgi:hypothetical protein